LACGVYHDINQINGVDNDKNKGYYLIGIAPSLQVAIGVFFIVVNIATQKIDARPKCQWNATKGQQIGKYKRGIRA
jgi:hypothetical protein